MDRFLQEVIEPLLSLQSNEVRMEKIRNIEASLKMFIRGEVGPLNKELAKKSKDLFMTSSDLETLREEIEIVKGELNKTALELCRKQQTAVRQSKAYEQEIGELKEMVRISTVERKKFEDKMIKELRKLTQDAKNKLAEQKLQLTQAFTMQIEADKIATEQNLSALKSQHQSFMKHLIETNNSDRSKLIKRYQDKVQTINEQYEQQILKLRELLTNQSLQTKSARQQVQIKLNETISINNGLKLELDREANHHKQFKELYEKIYLELSDTLTAHQEEICRKENEKANFRNMMKDIEEKCVEKVSELQAQLLKTIQSKKTLYEDIVEQLRSQHQFQLDSLRDKLLEAHEQSLRQVQIRYEQQTYKDRHRSEQLQDKLKELEQKHVQMKEEYEQRLKSVESETDSYLKSVMERRDYEVMVEGKNAKRELLNLTNKFLLQIQSSKESNRKAMQVLEKKMQQEKTSITNKLTEHYQTLLQQQKSSSQVLLKQKSNQFQRKTKSYEKLLEQSQKIRSQLKAKVQKTKLEGRIKWQSMVAARNRLQQRVDQLEKNIFQHEKNQLSVNNEYEYKLLVLQNQLEQVKQQYSLRQEELRSNLNDRISKKNKQMAQYVDRVKMETQALLAKQAERIELIESQYDELKRVVVQKTSLPEDIEALKTFHAAYLRIEEELTIERGKREQLARDLAAKDAVDKVFMGKEFRKVVESATQKKFRSTSNFCI